MSSRLYTSGSDMDLAGTLLHRGDERAFREMHRRHTPRLLGFASRLLGEEDAEAEDVVQETWMRACGNLEKFRWESELSTWLLGIGLNVVRRHMRRNGRLGRNRTIVMVAEERP